MDHGIRDSIVCIKYYRCLAYIALVTFLTCFNTAFAEENSIEVNVNAGYAADFAYSGALSSYLSGTPLMGATIGVHALVPILSFTNSDIVIPMLGLGLNYTNTYANFMGSATSLNTQDSFTATYTNLSAEGNAGAKFKFGSYTYYGLMNLGYAIQDSFTILDNNNASLNLFSLYHYYVGATVGGAYGLSSSMKLGLQGTYNWHTMAFYNENQVASPTPGDVRTSFTEATLSFLFTYDF